MTSRFTRLAAETREQLLADLRRDEGFRGEPYADHLGHPTIGYGCLLPISQPEAETLLQGRADGILLQLDHDLRRVHGIELSELPETAKRALGNMAYQLGIPRLRKFRRMFAAIRDGHWLAAEEEALDSRWAKQTPARAKRVAALLASAGSTT